MDVLHDSGRSDRSGFLILLFISSRYRNTTRGGSSNARPASKCSFPSTYNGITRTTCAAGGMAEARLGGPGAWCSYYPKYVDGDEGEVFEDCAQMCVQPSRMEVSTLSPLASTLPPSVWSTIRLPDPSTSSGQEIKQVFVGSSFSWKQAKEQAKQQQGGSLPTCADLQAAGVSVANGDDVWLWMPVVRSDGVEGDWCQISSHQDSGYHARRCRDLYSSHYEDCGGIPGWGSYAGTEVYRFRGYFYVKIDVEGIARLCWGP